MAATGAALRQEMKALHADLFDRRLFDPFLRFASPEDEDAYRQREEETRRYIAQQLATKTPEGELNAAGATMCHMLDAHAHGADASPDFLPRWTRLVQTTQRHREALHTEGRDTTEFDRNLVTSVRRYLRDKGLSEAAIDAALASASDPLDAVKPYLKSDKDAQALERPLEMDGRLSLAAGPPVTRTVATEEAGRAETVLAQQAVAPPGIDDVMAMFKTAGVVAAPTEGSSAFDHGVSRTHAGTSETSLLPR